MICQPCFSIWNPPSKSIKNAMKSPFKINTESAAESEFSTTQKCLCDLKLLLFPADLCTNCFTFCQCKALRGYPFVKDFLQVKTSYFKQILLSKIWWFSCRSKPRFCQLEMQQNFIFIHQLHGYPWGFDSKAAAVAKGRNLPYKIFCFVVVMGSVV